MVYVWSNCPAVVASAAVPSGRSKYGSAQRSDVDASCECACEEPPALVPPALVPPALIGGCEMPLALVCAKCTIL